jgi:hypothetical protein
MRTCVRMAPRPYNPKIELAGALDQGHLDHAIMLAREVAEESRRPIALDVALGFLPLVARERTDDYDGWALRWLVRWATESPDATIDRAAEIACSLADAHGEPLALDSIRQSLGSE